MMAHLRNVESRVGITFFFFSSIEANEKRTLSEPRRAEALSPWYTWTSIMLARETLHFQPIGISHSHGAKHCFVENFSSVCLSVRFSPFSQRRSPLFYNADAIPRVSRIEEKEGKGECRKNVYSFRFDRKFRRITRGISTERDEFYERWTRPGSIPPPSSALLLSRKGEPVPLFNQRRFTPFFSFSCGQCSCKITPPPAVVARSSLEQLIARSKRIHALSPASNEPTV